MSETLLHFTLGKPADDCPLCRATARGATAAEILALAADPTTTLPPGAAVALLDLRATCDACRVPLDASGCCPRCGVAHGGDPCPTCGRRGLHADDCTDPGDPWMEAGPAAKGGTR